MARRIGNGPARNQRVPDRIAGLSLAGAVPLDPKPAAGTPSTGNGAAAAPQGGAGAPVTVVDVTEATFATEVLERSQQVPVVIDFWADWCGPCKQLSPILERLATADGGRWVLAKIDVDANPRLAQAAAVQGIPAVKAVVGGRMIGEFTGALPEREVRGWLDQLLAAVSGEQGAAGEPEDPELDRAEAALANGDLDGALGAFKAKLAQAPGDPNAVRGAAWVELLMRARVLDPQELRRRQQANPTDVTAVTGLADLQVVGGDPESALAALVELIRATSDAERERARAHLVGLFLALGDDDPAVPPARRALAAALF
jgi:putative thioredoxin